MKSISLNGKVIKFSSMSNSDNLVGCFIRADEILKIGHHRITFLKDSVVEFSLRKSDINLIITLAYVQLSLVERSQLHGFVFDPVEFFQNVIYLDKAIMTRAELHFVELSEELLFCMKSQTEIRYLRQFQTKKTEIMN